MRQGTIGDIAADHKVSPQRADQWRKAHPDFPPALRNGSTGRLYDLDKVDRWAQRHKVGKHREPTA